MAILLSLASSSSSSWKYHGSPLPQPQITRARASAIWARERRQRRTLLLQFHGTLKSPESSGRVVAVKVDTEHKQKQRSGADSVKVSEAILLDVGGMICGGCVARVRNLLLSDSRVDSAGVNVLTQTAAVRVLLPPLASSKEANAVATELSAHLTECGFSSKPRQAESADGTAERRQQMLNKKHESLRKSSKRVVIAWALVALCCGSHAVHFLHSIGFHSVIHGPVFGVLHSPYWKCAIAILTLLGPARDLVADGINAFMRRSPNMNSLVGIGACAAFSISTVSLADPSLQWDASFFDEPVMLLAFVLLGRTLEERARLEASSDMNELLSLVPLKSRLVVAQNIEADMQQGGALLDRSFIMEVDTEKLRHGDRVLVLPGEVIPIDGTIVSGRSVVDESMLTGEPLLVTKSKDLPVFAGTINWEGPVHVQATASGSLSSIQRIIHMVEEAQGREAPVQRLADSLAGPFAITIMAISGATFIFWYFLGTHIFPDVVLNGVAGPQDSTLLLSLKLATDVLVVACPCALGLATPTAVLVGTSLGAKRGLLLRGGDVLERLANVDILILDKTGTLTTGNPTVAAVSALDGHDEQSLLQLAAGVEKHSFHPIASAILKQAEALNLEPLFSEGQLSEPGYGALAYINGTLVAIGLYEWVQGCCIKHPENKDMKMDVVHDSTVKTNLQENLAKKMDPALLRQSKTVVYVGVEEVGVVGAIVVTDPIRSDANATVSRLQDMGIKALILSGDREEAVASIARCVGLGDNDWHAGLCPSSKCDVIVSLQARGFKVAMVGDGINDAPALACADIGMALKSQVRMDAASDAASVVLLGNRLSQVIEAIGLAKATIHKVHQNLAWAVAYNIICIPLAAGVLLPNLDFALSPSVAGGMMAFSSIFVVTNSLLLRLHPSVRT